MSPSAVSRCKHDITTLAEDLFYKRYQDIWSAGLGYQGPMLVLHGQCRSGATRNEYERNAQIVQRAEAYKLQVESAFAEAIDRIAEMNREPTRWEAECLFAALTAIATDSYRLAQSMIDNCNGGPSDSWVEAAVPSDVTLRGLRSGLAEMQAWRKDST